MFLYVVCAIGVLLAVHYCALGYFYFVSGKIGQRVIADKLAFHIDFVYRSSKKTEKSSPVIVFESSIGYGMTCWAYIASQCRFDTLCYQRAGYGAVADAGWSKQIDYSSLRTCAEMAKELRILLEQLGVGHRPIILVAHSFGGILSQTFVQLYETANVVGLVLLDPPLDYSPLVDKMPRMLRLTGNLADSGLLRIASFFSFAPIQLTALMKTRLGPSNFRYLSDLLLDSNNLNAMAEELENFKASLERLKNEPIPKRPKMGVVVVSPRKVDKPKDVQMDDNEYTSDWHGKQKELALSLNGLGNLKTNFILSDEQHADLCVSDSTIEAIEAIVNAHGFKSESD